MGPVSTPKELEAKFHPKSSMSSSEYKTYEQTEETLINVIRMLSNKHTDDMVSSIKKMKIIDMQDAEPELEKSDKDDPADRAEDNVGFVKKYEMDMKRHAIREDAFRENRSHVTALILERFITSDMHEKLRNESDFKTTLECPVELLKRIKRFMEVSESGKYRT